MRLAGQPALPGILISVAPTVLPCDADRAEFAAGARRYAGAGGKLQ
jgi:hypothetical protein